MKQKQKEFLSHGEAVRELFPELNGAGLRALRALGFITGTRQGNTVYYSVEELTELRKTLDAGLRSLEDGRVR
jgi:hypothetical protein